jgi:hypothetical protein
MRQILAYLKQLCRRLSVKFFAVLIYLSALMEYWFAPWGLRGGLASRLRELPSRGALNPLENLEKPSRIALFVAFSPRLTLSNHAYVNTLAKAGFSVIYICNCPLDVEAKARIAPLVWRLIERRNLGRDVGAFRDGVLLLAREGLLDSCSTLVIANDSMQFIPGTYADSLAQSLRRFDEEQRYDGLFSHISQAFETHYQSYFQVLGKSIIRSSRFLEFWQNYLPLSHRGHCIFQGEIALSSSVYRSFNRLDVLYTSETLQRALRKAFAGRNGVPASEIMRLMPSPARTIQRRKTSYTLDQILHRAQAGEMLAFWELDWLADLIEVNNPSHVAAFLYPIYLGCPLVKQDLCLAGTYTFAQAISLFREAVERSAAGSEEPIDIDAHVQEYSDLLYTRGTPMSYSGSPRISALKGITSGFTYHGSF